LIVLNNLNSGNHTLTVYNHDGAHFNEVSNFNFYVAKPWYFLLMILLYLVLIGSIIHLLQMEQNALRSKLKLQEEELKYQKKILEIELKADNGIEQSRI
jgi:cytochrome c biogenesis protein ResB